MNKTTFTRKILATASLVILGAVAQGQVANKVSPANPNTLQKRLTHEELLERQKKMRQEMAERDAVRIDPTQLKERKKKDRGDIISRSTILSYGKTWTIVPKGAVLHVPSYLSARVDGERSKRFVSWKDFYQNNRGWIHLQNVKMQQARGKEEMPEGAAEAYPKIGRVVVAVCHGGPISVVPPKEEEEGETAEAAKAAGS